MARSAFTPRLRRRCQDIERFVFCATTGRSGTQTLAAVLAAGEGVVAAHEPFPIMNAHVLRAAVAGHNRTVRLAWSRMKLPTILSHAGGYRVYAETNHMFVKVFADLAHEEFGARLAVVHLVRDRLAVARSLHELGMIPGSRAGDRWLLDPTARTNLVPFSCAAEPGLNHPLHRCLWYCLEIEARAATVRRTLAPACQWIDIDVEELNSRQGLERLDERLDLRLAPSAFEAAGRRFNRKPKRAREQRRLSDEAAASAYREFMDAYAEWIPAAQDDGPHGLASGHRRTTG